MYCGVKMKDNYVYSLPMEPVEKEKISRLGKEGSFGKELEMKLIMGEETKGVGSEGKVFLFCGFVSLAASKGRKEGRQEEDKTLSILNPVCLRVSPPCTS